MYLLPKASHHSKRVLKVVGHIKGGYLVSTKLTGYYAAPCSMLTIMDNDVEVVDTNLSYLECKLAGRTRKEELQHE